MPAHFQQRETVIAGEQVMLYSVDGKTWATEKRDCIKWDERHKKLLDEITYRPLTRYVPNEDRICFVRDCGQKVYCGDRCQRHYALWFKARNPEIRRRKSA